MDKNPIDRVRKPSYPKPESARIAQNDLVRIIDGIEVHSSCPERDTAMVALAVGSGLRRAEIAGLYLEDVDLHRRILHLTGRGPHLPGPKGGKNRVVPFGLEAKKRLQAYLKVRPPCRLQRFFLLHADPPAPMTIKAMKELIRRIKRWANVEDRMKGWHDFRHTFSNEWVADDGNMRVLQEILGHSSINTTAFFYTRPNVDDLVTGHRRHSVSAIPNLNGLKLGVEPIFDSNDAKPAENCNNPSTMCKFEPTKSNQVVKIGKQLATFGIADSVFERLPDNK